MNEDNLHFETKIYFKNKMLVQCLQYDVFIDVIETVNKCCQ